MNLPLREEVILPALKERVVHPLLKRPSLDTFHSGQYCPVSNLPFMGKAIKKLVGQQLQVILEKMGYLGLSCSDFRSGHSKEIALVDHNSTSEIGLHSDAS